MTTVDTFRGTARASGTPVAGERRLGWLCLIGGAVGFTAAFALMVEKIVTLGNPDYVPSCGMNPVVSCGSVMDAPQAAAFGFPNPLMGVAAFAVVATSGVVLLAGFSAPRWFWLGMQLGTAIGAIFVHWLIYQSLYEIGALCPYCVVVWMVTIPIFAYTTLYNLERGHLPWLGGRAVVAGLARFHTAVLSLWYLTIVGLILHAFWDYWASLA